MPRLLLLRHAKAERAHPGENDHERALSKQGRLDAAEIGEMIAGRGERPDLVLCSTSARTKETWEGVRQALATTPEVRFLPAMYDADDYIELLRMEGEEAESVLLIGHNPAAQKSAVALAADIGGKKGAEMSSHFPTAGLAILEFDGAWATLGPRRMRILAFLRAREGGQE